MTRLICFIFILSSFGLAQQPVELGQGNQTGTITSTTCPGTGCVSVGTVSGNGTVVFSFHGTYAGVTVTFEQSDDNGTTWYQNECSPENLRQIITGIALPTNGSIEVACGAYSQTNVRVRATAYTSGTVNVGATWSAASIEPAQAAAAITTDNSGNAISSNSTTTTSTFGLDVNLRSILNVVPSVSNGTSGAGDLRVNIASDNTAIANWGMGATGSSVPSGAQYIAGNGSGNLFGLILCDQSSPINVSTATTVQIIAISGTAGRTYICSLDLVVGGADNVTLISGSGTNCASNQAAIIGGTAAANGWNFGANGGISKGSGVGMIWKTTTTNNEVCLVTSAATQASGSITWTQF